MLRCRWILVFALLLAFALRLAAAAPSAEEQAFEVASRDLAHGWYPQAEAEFAQFARDFTNSTRLPEAFLFQAEARLKLPQPDYAGAVDLLTTHQAQAGDRADQYIFWLAEAWLQKGEYAKASELFGEITSRFPESSRGLEAAIRQATAYSKLGDWPRVSQLLQQNDGVFQKAIRTNLVNQLTLQGYLLLGESLLAQKEYRSAGILLRPSIPDQLEPKDAWRWEYLLCRIAQADGRLDDALQGVTNLISLAALAGQIELRAVSVGLQGEVLEQRGRLNDAIAAYTNNLAAAIPPQHQRQALLKITELSLEQGKVAQAAQWLEGFLAKYPDAPSADYARLRLGEMRLLQFQAGLYTNFVTTAGTNAPIQTNTLMQAIGSLNALTNQSPANPYFGKAQLDLGWCYWLQTNLPQAQAAFQAATEHLPPSLEQATAYFKLGDVQFLCTNHSAAVTSYLAAVEQFIGVPQVETNLLERALYQVIRASLAAGDLSKATNALAKLLAWYPRGFHAYTDGALLLTGQTVSQQGDPAAARDLYLRFARSATNSSLLPQIGLAVARTYEEETNWNAAISQYKHWLATYTNSVLRPSAEYYCGWANSQAGYYTNALTCFTNLVVRFPADNDFAPLAQLWVADYYYGIVRDLVKAEGKYIDLYRNTNWHRPDLTYQAYLMAGRAALNVGSYSDAINNFTNLTSIPNCPPRFWTSAMLAYGETLMSRESTNSLEKMADYRTASLIFDQVSARFPTNPVALLALYRKGCCLLQRSEFEEAGGAINAFSQILTNSLADASIRSKAALGLAATFEAQAKMQNGAELTNLLDRALSLYLDVLHGAGSILRPGEARDVFWTQKAGMEAARLLESQKKWDDAIRAYQEMIDLFPPLRSDLEKRILRAQKNQAAQTA